MSDADPRGQSDNSLRVTQATVRAAPAAGPPASSLFQPLPDRHGLRLALVFGNHAPGGRCPYYVAARCHHCDIGAGEGAAFDHETNLRRLAWFREHYADLLPQIAHLVLYNSGSVLNPREMPPETLGEILAFARSLPAIRVVSLDSREAFIKPETLTWIAGILGPGRAVRPILGLETANDQFRNQLLEKQMPRAAVVRAFEAVGVVAAHFGTDRVGLDVNVVIAGPGTVPGTAIEDAVGTARFAFQTALRHGYSVDLNLHPYYPSARGLARFPGQGRCPLAVVALAVRAICELRRSLAPTAGIFIGWQDEGHDLEPDLRASELARARDAFDRFNRMQDPGVLDSLKAEVDPRM